MSRSAPKIRDVGSSVQREFASLKNRRSVSVDTRARGSYIPDRKRPSSEERKSGNIKLAVRWAGPRKSSINFSETKRKDVRPLTDKAYQKRKIAKIVEFLEENGFTPPMTPSKLMFPSKKDFENIFQFLYRNFDPTYEVKKIEEEGPRILRNLCYPFTVNKSAFVCITRTNWPSLLGVLIWLIDLNEFVLAVDIKCLFETAGDDEGAAIHKILANYICQCYHSGIDDEEQENDVFSEIVKSYILKENFDDLIAKKDEKEIMLESVERELDEQKALVERDVVLDKNMKKYDEYIAKMKTHYENRNELLEQLLQELKLKESELITLQEEISKKEDAYEAQGFDGKKHVAYFEIQKKELAEKHENRRTIVNQLQNKIWEAEIEYKKKSEKVIASAEVYIELSNSIAESLKGVLSPLSSMKLAQIQQLCGSFHLDFPTYEFNPNNHNTQFKDAWKDIGEKVKSVHVILKKILDTLNQKLTEIELKKSEGSMKLKLLTIEENKQSQEWKSLKKIADDEVSKIEAQCKKSQEVVNTIQDECLELEKVFREMIEEKRILDEFLEEKESELKKYLKEQKVMFHYFSKSEKEALSLSQKCGNEIALKLEELKDMSEEED